MASAFDGVRVVDVSDRLSGAWAARLFGDFGADVVLAEPPEGHPLRRAGPFLAGARGPESSLLHAYASWNKRSVVLRSAADLRALTRDADLVVTTTPPGFREEIASALEAMPEEAVHLSITPHGLDGPLAAVPGNNLTACARVGWSDINQAADQPPLQLPVRQTGYIAGVAGFVGAAAALLQRGAGGSPGRVDVSEIEALALTCAPWASLGIFIGGGLLPHGPNGRRPLGSDGPLWRTRDGLINFGYGDWRSWAEAMRVLGLPELAEDEELAPVLGRHTKRPRRIRRALAESAATRGKWELFHGLTGVHCIAGVVQDTRDLVESEQLNARGFIVTSRAADRRLRAAGATSKLSATPWALRRPAPRLDEHRDGAGRAARHERPAAQAAGEAPLAGVRVLTFTQAWAGTFATELLALLGADVVQIESRRRPDVWRGAGAPVPPGVRDPSRTQSPLNTNGMYNSVNLNKRAITLDMEHPRGREIFWRLVPRFDVLADNFSPSVMTKWGVTLETLREQRPDIIFASLSGYGREGPWAELPANGATTEPMSGLSSIHGYAGEPASNTGGLIPDPITGYYFTGAILAALHHRQRTGEGQRIDTAMLEAVALQLGEHVMAHDDDARIAAPSGNRHPDAAPHGVYPAADDEWIAIAAETDAAWQRLAAHLGRPQLGSDARFATARARKAHEDELDALLSGWSRSRDAAATADALGKLGVCAARAERFLPTYEQPGPQLRGRAFLVPVTHPESGTHYLPVAPWIMSGSPRPEVRPAPRFGEHSREVFSVELGIRDEEYAELEALGITGTTRLP